MSQPRTCRPCRSPALAGRWWSAWSVAACGGSSATPTPAPPTRDADGIRAEPVRRAGRVGTGGDRTGRGLAGRLRAGRQPRVLTRAHAARPRASARIARCRRAMSNWPTSVIDATISLAAADNEFKKAAGDWTAGAEAKDMTLCWLRPRGCPTSRTSPWSTRSAWRTSPSSRTVGADLVDVFTVLKAAGQQVNDTAIAGDTPGFEAAVKDLSAGMAAYGTAREPMIDAAELALVMRRGLLVK